MHSPRDARVPFEFSREAAAAITDARLEPIDSPNHTPLFDEPAFGQVQRRIEDFVDEDAQAGWPERRQATASRPALRAIGASARRATDGS